MFILPQKGMPSGVHFPLLSHILLEGPRSSNPRSHAYVATVPSVRFSSVKVTRECAGAPGKRHDADAHPEIEECISTKYKIILKIDQIYFVSM